MSTKFALMEKELHVARIAARQAGAITQQYYGGNYDLHDKDGNDPVTTADLEANKVLRKQLLEPFPHYGWLSEETVDSPDRLDRESTWIVDPIDGTREFIDNIPEYVISIALVKSGEPIVAVIYNPPANQLFYAMRRHGTFLNGKRVYCRTSIRLSTAELIVSRSETRRGETNSFKNQVRTLRPVGSVAYKLALVAAGRADLNVSVQPKNEWDVCAGDLLVREGGGQMLDLNGTTRRYNQIDPHITGGLVAGNRDLTTAALKMIRGET